MQERPKIPVADEYVSALGRAAYNFSYLEWGVVWLAETLSPDFLKRVPGMTAGMIANEFQALANRCSEPDASELQSLGSTFKSLVADRNALFHGVPYTAANDEQRLLHIGPTGRRDWSVEAICHAGGKFEEAALQAKSIAALRSLRGILCNR